MYIGNTTTEFEDGFDQKRFGPVGVKNFHTDFREEGRTLRFEIFKISKLSNSCIVMRMDSGNDNMNSKVENFRPGGPSWVTPIFENGRMKLKFGIHVPNDFK